MKGLFPKIEPIKFPKIEIPKAQTLKVRKSSPRYYKKKIREIKRELR